MDEQKQDGKKTVVAFVAGLVIGGLLVWLFAGTPENDEPKRTSDDAAALDALQELNERGVTLEEELALEEETTPVATAPAQPSASTGSWSVANQPAGALVSLGDSVQYPSAEGWIVVHDDVTGNLGGILGAARYETAVGLMPKTVELQRSTETGKTYRVVFYTESGDKRFDHKVDTPMRDSNGALIATAFTAQ